jgi:molybdopterin/thiamine biosynthesis adenylyltransferase
VAQYLAAAGVGTLRISTGRVELSNLNRQLLHATAILQAQGALGGPDRPR